LCYSGDTRPCDSLVNACRGAGRVDLLIHEATFGAGKEEDAKKKKHSTAREACEVARSGGIKAVVLTHFSQRYQSRGGGGEEGEEGLQVVRAVDFLRLVITRRVLAMLNDVQKVLDYGDRS